jgi:hypothetical protein
MKTLKHFALFLTERKRRTNKEEKRGLGDRSKINSI